MKKTNISQKTTEITRIIFFATIPETQISPVNQSSVASVFPSVLEKYTTFTARIF
jgi:hypothetical protein